MSVSKRAEIPANNIVSAPAVRISGATPLSNRNSLNRTNKYTPAVTSVDECTREETGVGAAIAAGSHAEKGTWALLVIAAITRRPPKHSPGAADSPLLIKKVLHCPVIIKIPIATRIRQSPTRFVSAVISPALKDFLLLK